MILGEQSLRASNNPFVKGYKGLSTPVANK